MLVIFIISLTLSLAKAANFNLQIDDISVTNALHNETLLDSFCVMPIKENSTCIKQIEICFEDSCTILSNKTFYTNPVAITCSKMKISTTIYLLDSTSLNESTYLIITHDNITTTTRELNLKDPNIMLSLVVKVTVTCQKGYLSPYCSESDMCTKLPQGMCQNNGTCIQLNSIVSCKCSDQFTGTFCQEAINPCKHNFCNNNSTCHINPDVRMKYTCECAKGFKGQFCNEDVNECDNTSICNNIPDATCINTYGKYICINDRQFNNLTTQPQISTTDSSMYTTKQASLKWPLPDMATLLLVSLQGAVILMLILVLIFIQVKHCPSKKRKAKLMVDDSYLFITPKKPKKEVPDMDTNYLRTGLIKDETRRSLAPLYGDQELDSFTNHLNDNSQGMSTFGRR